MIVAPGVVVDPEPRERLQCPGCGYTVWYKPGAGWENVVSGSKCVSDTVHSDHVITLDFKGLEDLY